MWRRAQIGAEPLSHSGNVRQAICEWYSAPRLRDPGHLLCTSIVLTDPLFDKQEALGSVSHYPTKSQWPTSCSAHEPIRLSTNKRHMPSSSCIKGMPDVKPFSYRPSPGYILSRLHDGVPHFALVRSSSSLSDITEQPFPPGVWLAWPKPENAGLLACSARLPCF